MTSPLAQLLSPRAVAPFLRRSWPERHLVAHGPLARLPAFVGSPLLADPRALARAYRGSVSVTNLGVGQYPVDLGPSPSVYFEDLGLSVRFDNLESMLPGAKEWLRELELELGVPRGGSKLVAFANAPGSGLVVHCDRTEQFAINLVGHKRFRVEPSPIRFPSMKHSPHARGSEAAILQAPDGLPTFTNLERVGTTHDLKPGSVLFTPRGLYHETLASRGVSLTLVVAVENPNPAEVLTSYLQRYLTQSERWRAPLRQAWSTQPRQRLAAKEQLRGLIAGLGPALAELDLELMLNDHRAASLRVTDCLPASRFQRDRSVVVTLATVGDDVTVDVARTPTGDAASQGFPRLLRPALRWVLASRAAFSLAALSARFPRWDPTALAAVLVFLVRARALFFLPVQGFDERSRDGA